MTDNDKLPPPHREITKKDLQAQSLTERQLLENKTHLIEIVRQQLETGSLTLDITEWLKNQFVASRNNEKLHAEMIRSSDFFDFFPGLKDWGNMNQFLRNSFGGVGFTTTLLLRNPEDNTVVAKEVQLTFDFLQLKKLADQYHQQANASITTGDMITESLSFSKLIGTFSTVFIDAIPR